VLSILQIKRKEKERKILQMPNDFREITKGKGLRIPHSEFRIPDSTLPQKPYKNMADVNKLTFTAFSPFFVWLKP